MRWYERIGWAILAVSVIGLGGCAQEEPTRGSWVEIIRPLQLQEDGFSPEEHPSFESVVVEADRLIYDFRGENPLTVGMVVGGPSGGRDGYIRRITAVTPMADGRIEATTEVAQFQDLVGDVHFIYHHNPQRGHSVAGAPGMLVAAAGGGGNCEGSGECDVGSSFFSNLGDATECSSSSALDVNLNPIFKPDFSGTDFEVDADLFSFSPSITVGMTLAGSLTVGAELTASANISGMCSADLVAAITGGDAPEWTLATLTIGPIPIVFTLEPVLEGCIAGALDAGEVRAWATGTISASAGVSWSSDSGPSYQEPSFNATADAGIETTRAGGARLSASLGAGGILHMRLFGVIGPWARVVGHIGAEFEALLGACDWTARVPWNVDWQLGGDIDLFGLWSTSFAWPDSPEFIFGDSPGPGQCIPVTGSNIIYQTGGTWGWCESTDPMCDPDTSDTVCNGDYLGVNVCPGQATFERCSGGDQIRRCTCDSSGRLTDCSACMDPPFPAGG